MATSLADPPTRAAGKQSAAPSAEPPAGADGLGAQQRACAKCGAPMASAQDWCFQCGAGAPGSLDTRAHRWRSGAAVLSLVALLVAGAAAAAYAALSKSSAKPRPVPAARAQAPAASPPAAAVPPPTASVTPPPTPSGGAAPVKPPAPLPKAPKVTLTTGVPKSPTTTPRTTTPTTTTTPAAGKKTPAGGTTPAQKQPTALVLDTNAASTYNPYGYPPSNFGDPSLAIDGEKSTAWTAVVDPAVAPKMAEGLVIDLKAAQKVSALALASATTGMTVQAYGATGSASPASITDPAWVPLSRLVVVSKSYERIPLGHSKQAFRFVALWISKAPASAVGTPTAPGHVRIAELELFP